MAEKENTDPAKGSRKRVRRPERLEKLAGYGFASMFCGL